MDNLTHTLIGLIAGEAVVRSTRPSQAGLPPNVRRVSFLAMAAIGGNLPDLDLLYSYAGRSNKLGYLLQHRGYTHTVVGCVVLALLLYAGVALWMRCKHLAPTRRDRLALAAMALFATMLHLAMDTLNSYGVHPFWPLQNRWYYGDSVFIVEPLYWAAAAPLFFVMRSTAARLFIALALLAAVLMSFAAHLVLPLWCVGFSIITVGLLAIGRCASPRTAALISAAITIGITGVFILAGTAAARRIESIAAASFAADRIIDHVLTPMPMNPLCWDVLLLETNADQYIARHGVLAIVPMLVPARQCPSIPSGPTTAPFSAPAAADSKEIQWHGEFSMSTLTLSKLVAAHCDAAAFMQFARAPFATWFENGWVIGDLRFDREPQLGMAEIKLAANTATVCPHPVPWTPPRAQLLH